MWIVEQENLHRLPAEQRNVRTAERAGACASARGSGLDYTRWFLKIGLYVYKYIILRRRKVVWGLGLQLFSGKWAVFWAFCRSEVAIRGAVRWPRENGAPQWQKGLTRKRGEGNHKGHEGHEEGRSHGCGYSRRRIGTDFHGYKESHCDLLEMGRL